MLIWSLNRRTWSLLIPLLGCNSTAYLNEAITRVNWQACFSTSSPPRSAFCQLETFYSVLLVLLALLSAGEEERGAVPWDSWSTHILQVWKLQRLGWTFQSHLVTWWPGTMAKPKIRPSSSAPAYEQLLKAILTVKLDCSSTWSGSEVYSLHDPEKS